MDTPAAASPPPSFIDSAWRVLASETTTAALVFLLVAAAIVAALVPQGRDAIAIARSADAVTLHGLVALGLTDVFGSPWVYALGVLLAGNLAAFVITDAIRASGESSVRAVPPRMPARKAELVAREP